MSPAERRQELLEVLCLRRHDTYDNLAHEFNVSKMTIRRDIAVLMCSYPIETVHGGRHGCVRVIEDFVAAHPDIELVSERVDDGYSGVLFDRPALKDLYTERAEQAQEAIDRLRDEMELVTNNSSSRLRWTQHFKEFSAMTTLDRRAVIAMVQSIRANGKNDLVITFRYLIEYIKVLKRLDRLGKLTPDLREILNTLTAEEKEAA